MDDFTQAEKDAMERFLSKLKQDPQYELKQEFGRMMLKQYELLTPEELKRYNELKELLRQPKD